MKKPSSGTRLAIGGGWRVEQEAVDVILDDRHAMAAGDLGDGAAAIFGMIAVVGLCRVGIV